MASSKSLPPSQESIEAGGGLINRRWLMKSGLAIGTFGLTAGAARAEQIGVPEWSSTPGKGMSGYGQPSPFESDVSRPALKLFTDGIADESGVSFTPLEKLAGTMTPNGLFFERHHSGIPEIDPAKHKFAIHGLVKRRLVFSVENLLRYPMVTRTCFIECAGNSLFNSLAEPQQRSAGEIHGLIGNAEWTGVPLALLLEEAGVDVEAKWLHVEGADAAKMSRSVPLKQALAGDAIIALYQNGERLRPEQGYPMRLVLPGWQGNMCVKWLRRIKLVTKPLHTKDETSKYTLLQKDGKARQFTFEMGVKSVITAPSPGVTPSGKGLYQVSGLAWSGGGRITRVEISADGGTSWADAHINPGSGPQALARFRLPWLWDGSPRTLMSRATDETGSVQPTREAWYRPFAAGQLFHQNAIQAWAVAANGEVRNVYA